MIGFIRQKANGLVRRYRLRKLHQEPSWHRVADNIEMKISSNDLMDRAFFLGSYDPALLCAIEMLVSPGDHCLDVGAHKGYVTLHLASAVGNTGQVFAFEPDPAVRQQLTENCERNLRTNVSVFPYALGQEDGEAEFFLSNQSGWSSRFPNQMAQSAVAQKVTVRIRSVDSLIAMQEMQVQPDRLSFMKIDCEGSEPKALCGMSGLFSHSDPILWLEVNRDSLAAANSSVHELENILAGYGLSFYQFRHLPSRGSHGRIEFDPLSSIPADQEFAFDIVATRRRLKGIFSAE